MTNAPTRSRRRQLVKRAVRVTCQACGCTDESELDDSRALEGSRLAALIGGAPVVRRVICLEPCLCHYGGLRPNGDRRALLTFHVGSPYA